MCPYTGVLKTVRKEHGNGINKWESPTEKGKDHMYDCNSRSYCFNTK